MLIRKIDSETGYITLEMNYKELRTLANLICLARKENKLSELDYKVNAELYTAVTILGSGRIPKFELNHIKELQENAGTEYDR